MADAPRVNFCTTRRAKNFPDLPVSLLDSVENGHEGFRLQEVPCLKY